MQSTTTSDQDLNRSNPLVKLSKKFSSARRNRSRSSKGQNSCDIDVVGSGQFEAAGTSLPSSPSLLADYRPLDTEEKKKKKPQRNNVLFSAHPALINDPVPLSFTVSTRDGGQLALTLDRSGVTTEVISGDHERMRSSVLSVPWYRVKSYEKHIKGHQFALVYQRQSQSRPDQVLMRRAVYDTDESQTIFKAMKRYIAWVAYHS